MSDFERLAEAHRRYQSPFGPETCRWCEERWPCAVSVLVEELVSLRKLLEHHAYDSDDHHGHDE